MQIADNPSDKTVRPLDFFRAKADDSANELTKENLLRAVNALGAFVGGADIDFDSFDNAMIGEWVSHLLFQGYTPATVSNNFLKRLATLYNKAVDADLAKPTDVFRTFRSLMDSGRADELCRSVDPDAFGKLQELIRSDYRNTPAMSLAKDMLLFAVYMGGMALDDIARFRKDDYKGDDKNILEIVGRYSRPRNSYLFPLDQIHSTPRQLRRRVGILMGKILGLKGLNESADPLYTTFDLWANAAMKCGHSASDIAACLGSRHTDCALTAFVGPSDLSEEDVSRIRSSVSMTLAHNPEQWYAMHLRRHTDLEDVTGRLGDNGITLGKTYYPMEEIVRKVGHRKVFENRPVISWLVFFRSRRTELDGIYSVVGDLAWGYRISRSIGSSYAAVSDTEVRNFQEAIGTLGPDTQILRDDEADLKEGDLVVILGGAMDGQRGEFVTSKRLNDGDGGRIVYRIRLSGGTSASWTVDRDPRLVRKIDERSNKCRTQMQPGE